LVAIDCNGTEIVTMNDGQEFYTLTGNTKPDGEQMHNVQWRFSIDQYSELNDYDQIYLKLSFGYGDSTRRDYITPYPIYIADTHEDIVWVKYNETVNKKSVLFEQMLPSFGICLVSLGLELIPAGEYETLDNQNDELSVIYSSSYNTYRLQIGGLRGIPEHLVPTVNAILGCKYIEVKGMRLTREDGAVLERVGQADTALKCYTVIMRDADTAQSYTFDSPEVEILRLPSLPAAYQSFYMTNGADTWGYAVARAIYLEAELDDVIDLLNADVTKFKKTGEFTKVNNLDGSISVFYVNGSSEAYYVNWGTPAPVLTQYLTLQWNVTNAAAICRYRFEQLGIHLTDWGDNFGICDENLGNLPGLQTLEHTYSSTGTKTVYLFTDNYVVDIRVENQTNKVTNIGGECPSNLLRLWLVNQDFSGLSELDLAPLSTCRTVLQTLNLSYSGIVKIKEGWSNYAQKAFGACKTWVLTGNAMSVTNTTKFMKEFLALDTYKGVAYTATGVIFIKQSPAAVIVDATTLSAIDTLTDPISSGGYGWAVVKD